MLGHGERANILFIIADQLRADSVGYVTPWISTPNLNRMAAEGVVCEKAYAQSPQCQPSRASLFTGRYPTAHRVWWNEISLPRSEVTLGNYLRQAGYHTAYFGKAHFAAPRDDATSLIRHFGFDRSLLTHDWQLAIRDQSDMLTATAEELRVVRHEFFSPMQQKHWTGRLSFRQHHHDEAIVDWAVQHLSTCERPFFTVVGFHGPHPPYAAPLEFVSRYDLASLPVPEASLPNHTGQALTPDEWRMLKAQYYGAISWIDDGVGRLLQAVQQHAPGTLVVFTADHGDILGDHGLFSKGMYCYEGNTRVPLVIYQDGLPLKINYDKLVQLIDLVPTLLTAVDVPVPPNVQGVSLWDALPTGTAVNRYALSMIGHSPRLRMIRQAGMKYWICGGDEFLFDLSADPGERYNLTDEQLLSTMRLNLLRALIQAEDPLPYPSF